MNKEKFKIIRYIAVCVLCLILGVFAGKAAGQNENDVIASWDNISGPLQRGLPYIYIAVFVVFVVCAVIQYVKVRSIEKSMDGSDVDDERAGKIEELVSKPILITNVLLIVSFFLFAANADAALFTEYGQAHPALFWVVPMILFFAAFIVAVVIQKCSLDIEKRINPEKTVSMFDINFNRKWVEAGDEAEKLKAYKAGYAGFRAMNMACMIFWIVTFVVQLIFKTGVFPIFIVCVIWCTGIIASTVEAIHQDRHQI